MENEKQNADEGSKSSKEKSRRWNIKSKTRGKEAEEAKMKAEVGK